MLNTIARAGVIALAIAGTLILMKLPLRVGALALFEGSAAAKAAAAVYVDIRLWGAPAELMNYALLGWFAGQGQTRRLFEIQCITSATNIALNLFFVLVMGWGVAGVALGTVIGSFAGLGFGLWRLAARAGQLRPAGWRLDWGRILKGEELARVMALNRDIMIRTLLLTGAFAWMTRLGSTQGDVILAANGILLQFIYLASHGLDGFAMAAEALVGQSVGARSRARLRRAVVVSSLSALVLAALISALFTGLAQPIVQLFTNVAAVRAAALEHALWATCMPFIAVLAYQLDGVFIGATGGPQMRNAMLVSSGLFFPLGWVMTHGLGNHGLWAAMWIWMALRALTLALAYPRLEARAGLA